MSWEIFALVSLVITGSLTSATIWSRKDTWVRGAAVAALLLAFPAIAGVGMFSLSHPAPYTVAQMTAAGDYMVLGTKMVQDVAIYVYLDFGGEHPRSFALPWDNYTANNLQGLIDRQRETGARFVLRLPPFDRSLSDNPPEFHPMPQPKAIPNKPIQEEEPEVYERSA